MNAPHTTQPITVRDLSLGYRERIVIDDLSLHLAAGEYLGLVGPNGSGKSTLLRAMARLLAPRGGTVLLDGQDINRMPSIEVARRMAVLPQGPVAPTGITVRELVTQGRFPHRHALARPTHTDADAVNEALELTALTTFADRYVDKLSGGERQRAWIALTIAQRADILLLDEPTTFLDIGHQFELLELIDRLRVERNLTVAVVLHDLNQAARFCDRLLVLSRGGIIATGTPREVLTETLLAECFGVTATIIDDPATGAVVCLPHGTSTRV